MRKLLILGIALSLAPLFASAEESTHFKWVDAEGVVHYGDSIPAKYAELPKEVVNDHGVTVGNLEGKKSEEERAAEQKENERRVAQELQQRADIALLNTYLTVEEILLHRDRRIELFQAQSRVTELYLNNLSRRLELIRKETSRYQPYSEDSDAPMITPELAQELKITKDTIERHEANLKKFKADERQINERFAGDISRFKILKGINED